MNTASTAPTSPARATGLWLIWVSFIVGGLYGGWSTWNDTGLGGWINHGQSLVFGGSYSTKLSFFLSMSIVAMAIAAAVSTVLRLFGTSIDGPREVLRGPGQQPPVEHGSKPSMKPTVAVGLGVAALGWVLGYGAFAWERHTAATDYEARYESFDLRDPKTAADAPSASHLRLQGRPWTQHAVAFGKRGTSGRFEATYWMVPVAADSWKRTEPIAWVMKVDAGLVDHALRAHPRGPWLVKTAGDLPRQTIEALKKDGLTVAGSARLLEWVPSRDDGKPFAPRDTSEGDQFGILLIGGIFTAAGLLTIVIVALKRRRLAART